VWRIALVCVFGALLVWSLRPHPPEAGHVARARWLMGTLWTAWAPAGERAADAQRVGAALDAALDTVASLERRLSNWLPSSELSRLNRSGEAIVSEPLYAVLDSACELAALTGGAFDPTVEALTLAWDLRGSGRTPSESEIETARSAVDWRRLSLEPSTRRVRLDGVRVDLGGIGKGYALDRAGAVLAALGVRGAELDAGGQRWSAGGAPGTTGSSVWVAHPLHRDRGAASVRLASGSLSTSGQSEHPGHVLDPRTGRPVATSASVSVGAASGTRADGLSTSLLVMGRERARAFADKHPEIGVLWLEPEADRVEAEAWNLRVVALAPGVRLTRFSHPEPLARIP